MRLCGVEEAIGEDTPKLAVDVINDRLGLSPPLVFEEIDRIHRVGAPAGNGSKRAILIKFATYRSRKRVYDQKKNFFTNDDSVPHLYLNEDVTRNRSWLLWQARKMKRNKLIKDAWTADGKILVKNNDGLVSRFKKGDIIPTR